jgi:hypothetical protein
MQNLKCLTAMYILLCVFGFAFQVQQLGSVYFAYKTRTLVDIAMPVRLVTPDMSLCIRYGDVYNGSQPLNNLTIANIFDGTPATSSLFSLCIYRHLHGYEAIIVKDPAKCNKEFTVDKFYNSEYVCYRFQKVVKESAKGGMQRFAYQNLANSPNYQGLFYAILIDLDLLKKADLCKVVVHAYESWPNDAIATAPYFFRFSDGVQRYNLIRAIYSTIEIIRMPSPYDTHCIKYPKGGRKGCENKCVLNGTIEMFNKVPFTTIEMYPRDIGHIGRTIIANKNNSMALDALERRCEQKCYQEECDSLFFSTSILKEERGDYDLFSVLVQAPITPRIKVALIPLSQLTDFLVMVTSCIGTWFGISAMSFNPGPIIGQRQKSRQNKDWDCRSCDDCLQSMNHMFDEIRGIKKLLLQR